MTRAILDVDSAEVQERVVMVVKNSEFISALLSADEARSRLVYTGHQANEVNKDSSPPGSPNTSVDLKHAIAKEFKQKVLNHIKSDVLEFNVSF